MPLRAHLAVGHVGRLAWPMAVALTGLLLSVLAAEGRPLALDRAAQELLDRVDAARLAAVVTLLGSGAVLYPVLAALCLRPARSWRDGLPVAVLVGAQAVEAVLTGPLPRAGAGTLSSGHAMTAVLGWGLVARQVPALRSRAVPLALLAGLVVGASRVELRLHWVSDVVAGGLLGLVVLLACAPLTTPVPTTGAVPPGWRSTVPATARRPRGGHRPGAPSAAAPVPAAPWRRTLRWARTSRSAWSLPAAAALVPLVPLLLEADRMIDLQVYVGAGSVAADGGAVYALRTRAGLPFTYPPFAAVLAEPLSRLPLLLVQVAWVLATLGALVAVARVAMAPVVARLGLPLVLAGLLVSSPVRSHLRFGQVGVFLVLVVALDLLRPAGRLRGWGLGLAAAVKLTPLVLLPWLLVTGAWRRLVGTVLWAGGASLLGLLVLWPSTGDYLWRALWDTSRFGSNAWPGNQSVRGALLRSGLPEPAAGLLWVAAVVLLVVLGTRGAARLERAGDRLAAVGVLAALSVAVSPISWVHHLVWLVLPLSALVAAGRTRLAGAWAVLLVVPLGSVGSALGDGALARLVVDLQGLTAVACVLLLPYAVRTEPSHMLHRRARRRPGHRVRT